MKALRKITAAALCIALIFSVTAELGALAYDAEYGSCEVHTFPNDGQYVVAKAPTCSSTGLKSRQCTVCGYIETQEIPVNPKAHTLLSSEWKYDPAPTCLEGGVKYRICYGCNQKAEITEVPADPQNGHVCQSGEPTVITAATCSSEGEQAYVCDLCGAYYGSTVIPVNGDSHVFSDDSVHKKIKDATCGEEGEIEWYCDLCGKLAYVERIPAHGQHTLTSERIVDVEPDCTNSGSASYHCTECSAHIDSVELPPVEGRHVYSDEYTLDVAPTCSSEGVKSRHCLYCDAVTDVTSVQIDENAHSFSDEWIVTQEPSCSQSGYKHKVCTLCGFEQISTVIDRLPHTYDSYEVIKISADGASARVKYTCTVCGSEVIDIIPLGENSGDGNIGDDDLLPSIHKLLPVEGTLYKVDNELLTVSNIARHTTLAKFSSNFTNGSSFVLYDASGAFVEEEDYVSTGDRYNYTDIDGKSTDYYLAVTGDVDSNGQITAYDARMILRASAGLESLEGAFFTAADVNEDGKITASDARKTLRVAAFIEYFESTYAQ